MAQRPSTSDPKKPAAARPQPGDNAKKQTSVDVDDAQLEDVTDDSAFKKGEDDSEITDENQRSESRVEPRKSPQK